MGDSELLFFFGMNLFDLIDTRNYKVRAFLPRFLLQLPTSTPKHHHQRLTFSDFAYGVTTFSMFGTEELLRWLFNCFDPERRGTINLDDFEMYTRLLHARNAAVHQVAGLGSNVYKTLLQMEKWVQEDKRIDYDEFCQSNRCVCECVASVDST